MVPVIVYVTDEGKGQEGDKTVTGPEHRSLAKGSHTTWPLCVVVTASLM